MQRILTVTITSHKDYSDAEVFNFDIATALRKYLSGISIKHNKTIEEATGKIVTKNKTTLEWKHIYKEES